MAKTTTDVQTLLEALDAKERKRRRNAFLYLGLPLVAGLTLTFWTARQALTLRRNGTELSELKQQIDEQKRSLEEAKSQLKNTRSAIEYIRFGINSFQAGNFSAAVSAYDRAIELDPMNPVVFDLKGYSLLRHGEIHKAIETLQRSVELDPTYIWGHYNLALAYWAAGERRNAVTEVRKVLELDRGFRNVIQNDVQFKKFESSSEYRALMNQ